MEKKGAMTHHDIHYYISCSTVMIYWLSTFFVCMWERVIRKNHFLKWLQKTNQQKFKHSHLFHSYPSYHWYSSAVVKRMWSCEKCVLNWFWIELFPFIISICKVDVRSVNFSWMCFWVVVLWEDLGLGCWRTSFDLFYHMEIPMCLDVWGIVEIPPEGLGSIAQTMKNSFPYKN